MGQVMTGLQKAGSTVAKPFVKFGAEGRKTAMPIGGDLEIPFAEAPEGARSLDNAHATPLGRLLRDAAFGDRFQEDGGRGRNMGALGGLANMMQPAQGGRQMIFSQPQAEKAPIESIEERLKRMGISPFNPQSGRP